MANGNSLNYQNSMRKGDKNGIGEGVVRQLKKGENPSSFGIDINRFTDRKIKLAKFKFKL